MQLETTLREVKRNGGSEQVDVEEDEAALLLGAVFDRVESNPSESRERIAFPVAPAVLVDDEGNEVAMEPWSSF